MEGNESTAQTKWDFQQVPDGPDPDLGLVIENAPVLKQAIFWDWFLKKYCFECFRSSWVI